MTTIEPGTPVRVVIEGVFHGTYNGRYAFDTALGQTSLTRVGDPAVTVTPLDPERPSLDLETIITTLLTARYETDAPLLLAQQGWAYGEAENEAHAILDLIQAAHPEWAT